MPPAVGGQLPSVVSETLGHFFSGFLLFLVARIVLIGGIGPVAEDALVSSHRDYGSGALIGEVRMLFDEILQQRNKIIGAGGDAAVVHYHFAGGFSVFSDNDPGGESVAFHIFIIAYVVLGHHEGLFPERQQDIARCHGFIPVFIRLDMGQVVEPDQHVAAFIHLLQDRQKFLLCRHDLVVAVGVRVPVKGLRVIHNKGVEEYMRNRGNIGADQGPFYFFIRSGRLLYLRFTGKLRV